MARTPLPRLRDDGNHVYRSQTQSIARLYRELCEARQREVDALPEKFAAIHARRVARTLAGQVAFGGMTAVFAWGAAATIYWTFDMPEAVSRSVGVSLVAVWLISAAAYALGRMAAPARFRAAIDRELTPTGDVHAEVSRLSKVTGADIARSVLVRHERISIAWPLIGAAMVVPLFLHYVFASAMTGHVMELSSFGRWVGVSALLVGHCHYFVAHQGAVFARDSSSGVDPGSPAWRALVVGVATSMMPGLAAFGIPCVIVGLTGVAFLPATYWAIDALVTRERAALRPIA